MASVTHVGVVRQWCQSLGVLSAISISREEAELKLAAFVPLLHDRFPDAVFCAASLEHCAFLARKGFPTYGELAGWLSEWWRERRPPPLQIAVEGSDQVATWREIERQCAESWDDPQAILASVRKCEGNVLLLRMLAAAVRRWAPQHLGYLPPHILELIERDPDASERHGFDREAPPAIRPSHLTPEQIELAGGRKRDAQLTAAADTPTAVAVDPDAAARMAEAYPHRNDET